MTAQKRLSVIDAEHPQSMTKVCKDCAAVKPLSEFTRNRTRPDGLSFYCKPCKKNRDNATVLKNPEKYAAKRRSYREKHLAQGLVTNAQDRARRLGLPCDITKDDIIIPKTCPVLGIELRIGNGKQHDASPSLDRFIPSLGYVKGNICVISLRANRIKNNATAEELMTVAKWVMSTEAH